jgi:Adenylosuccinate lyase
MIKRYSRKEMVDIWSSEEKYKIWLEIEAHACDAMAAIGKIPKSSAKNIWKKGKI